MFISAFDNKDDRLSNFAENVEVHFAFRKKTEILGKARNLLLQCDFSVPQVSLEQLNLWACGFDLLVLINEVFCRSTLSEAIY